MDSKTFVRTFGPYLYVHPDNRIETLNAGSVVGLDEETARQYVERGLGDYADGPESSAPPAPEALKAENELAILKAENELARLKAEMAAHGAPSVERQDLGEKLSRAERQISVAQRH